MQKRKVEVSFIEFIPGFGVAVGNAGEVFEGSDEIVEELVSRGKLPAGKDKKPSAATPAQADTDAEQTAQGEANQEGAPA